MEVVVPEVELLLELLEEVREELPGPSYPSLVNSNGHPEGQVPML